MFCCAVVSVIVFSCRACALCGSSQPSSSRAGLAGSPHLLITLPW
jgi:hypothetical protein